MKITIRGQGYRFTRRGWPTGDFIDVKRVKKDSVEGVGPDGQWRVIVRREDDSDWIRLMSTVRAKRIEPSLAGVPFKP